MNKLFKLQVGIITAVLFTVAITSPVLAGIGISPASLLNNQLKPGTTFRQEINISQSDPNVALTVTVEPDIQGVNDWFTFEPGGTFQIAQGQNNASVTMVLTIPDGAELKDYKGFLRVKATPVGSAALGGVSVVKGARLDVNLSVTEQDLVELLVRSIEPKPSDRKGSIVLGLKIENKGNVAAAPTKVEMEIEDLNLNPITTLSTNDLDEIAVSETKEIQAVFPNNLAAGEYFANVKVYLNDTVLREDRINLKVEEGGSDIPVSDGMTDGRLIVVALVLIIGTIIVFLLTRVVMRKMVLITPKKKLFIQILAVVLYILLAGALLYLTLFYVSANGSVQGISSDRSRPVIYEREVSPPARTFEDSPAPEYFVYASPDTNSAVIYTVQEGEKFSVIEEKDNWYKVNVKGTDGWLQRKDVKQVNQEIIPD